MSMTENQIRRGKQLDELTNEDFIALWSIYRHMTLNELNALEPFYVVSAMKRLQQLVKG